jgi:hypothetical protein
MLAVPGAHLGGRYPDRLQSIDAGEHCAGAHAEHEQGLGSVQRSQRDFGGRCCHSERSRAQLRGDPAHGPHRRGSEGSAASSRSVHGQLGELRGPGRRRLRERLGRHGLAPVDGTSQRRPARDPEAKFSGRLSVIAFRRPALRPSLILARASGCVPARRFLAPDARARAKTIARVDTVTRAHSSARLVGRIGRPRQRRQDGARRLQAR